MICDLPIALTYGLTECASQVATATPDQVRAKPGTVGKPLNGTTVRIVDANGQDVPTGEYGEIVVSGATVMKGYLGQPQTNGTFATGDIGYLDADGDLWIVQRRSDLIVSGGENVYPSEVEAVLRSHPAVEDACVVGVADAEWGQRVAAMVALRAGETVSEADLIAYSRERLAGYKQPRTVVFVDELPQTASGKVHAAERFRIERCTQRRKGIGKRNDMICLCASLFTTRYALLMVSTITSRRVAQASRWCCCTDSRAAARTGRRRSALCG